MPYQVGSACYESALAAAQVAASTEIGRVVSHGGNAFVVNAASVAEGSITYSFQPLAGGPLATVVAAYTAQPCNLLSMNDGLQLGWLVVACWASVYGVMFLRRALMGETVGNYGNS